ncbi:MAG: fumarylacetoacetate hydrolase family protein [Candidatus Hydrogenedentes bacterium]|nr:fumarylacetoacetate hydrolase family protein [Candidatus Hydrogenedentota bacterium]
MKVALVSTEADPVVALYARNRWLDLSGAYPTYQWLTYGVKPQPVHHIEPFLEADLLTPENLEKVVACLEQHDLLATYQLPGEPNLLLPFRPKQIFAMGRNYAAHAAETGHDAPKEPILFSKSPRSCIGHGQPIIVRPDYGQVDHEAELAGPRCKCRRKTSRKATLGFVRRAWTRSVRSAPTLSYRTKSPGPSNWISNAGSMARSASIATPPIFFFLCRR